MNSATATVDAALYAVRLQATGTTGTVDWYRRYAGANTHVATGALAYDYAPDLNTPYEYIAVDDTDSQTTAQVTVPADRPVLSSTTSPLARAVTVVDARPYEGEGRSVWHPVLGRTDPFVTIHPALYPAGTLRFYAATHSERVALIRLMERGEPMHLRTTCPERLDTMVFIMTRWRDPFTRDGARSGPAYIEVDYQRVTEVPGIAPPAADRTWQTVLDDHTAWQDVLDGYGSWRDVLDGP